MDETYVKVKGEDRYLYRAVDSNGNTLDMWLRNRRDTVSTKAFMKRLIRDYGKPLFLKKNVPHWKSKYLNNILEQDHRQVAGLSN